MPKVRKKAEGIGTVQTEVGQRVDGLETENDCAACGCLRLEPRQHAISDPSERGGALPRELGPLALRRLGRALLGRPEALLSLPHETLLEAVRRGLLDQPGGAVEVGPIVQLEPVQLSANRLVEPSGVGSSKTMEAPPPMFSRRR